MMNVFIRADSSFEIGSGHVMRCLTLANALRKKGAIVSFICRELPGNICDFIELKGFKVYRLAFTGKEAAGKFLDHYSQWLSVSWEKDVQQSFGILKTRAPVDWLIIDHYGLDEKWESSMRPFAKKIMVIDDLANRPHDCDVLLDQNLYQNMNERYERLIPWHCIRLLGPDYALLRDEFLDLKQDIRDRNRVGRILVFFGGSDPSNETNRVLQVLKKLNLVEIEIDVVVGINNLNKDEVKRMCSDIPASFYCQVENMAQLMNRADVAIGAGGSATWERAFLGLPGIIMSIEKNQEEIAKCSARAGFVSYLGIASEVSAEMIKERLCQFIQNPSILREMSSKGRAIVDGKGQVRILEKMGEMGKTKQA